MEGRDRQMLMAFFTGLAVGGSLVGMLGFSALASVTAAVALVCMALLVWIFVEHGDTKLLAFGGSGVAKEVNEKEPGFKKPYTIQKRGIVPFCRGLDVIEQAHPGTGKTAACCIGILQRLDYGLNQCQALVLTPRNDLAMQTEKLMRALGKYLGVRVLACVGGASVREDKQNLQVGVHVVVGTPGSVFDMFHWEALCGDHIKIFVLDEADELLTGGFEDQIRDIFVPLPSVQAGLFSATMSPKCLVLTRKCMYKPVRIFQKPPDELNLEGFNQFYVTVDQFRWKLEKITELYNSSITQTVIFVNTTDRVEWDTCNAIVREFHAGSCRVLITDDVMVDCINALPQQQQQQESVIVVNYDLLDDLEDYVHRLGPSLRFRRKGHVICFVAREEEIELHDIQRFYNVDIKELPKMYTHFI